MKSKLQYVIPFFSFLFLFFLVSFFYGAAVGHYKIWPYETISQIKASIISFYKYGRLVPNNRIIRRPSYAKSTRVYKRSSGGINNGSYAIMGYNHKTNEDMIWLLNKDGKTKHSWNINYQRVAPKKDKKEHGGVHGMLVLKDGSVLVAYDQGDVMARFDKCSKPIWIKPGHFHHSFDLAEDGTVWTWQGIGNAYAQEQSIINFKTDTGEIINSINFITDVLKKSDRTELNFSIPTNFKYKKYDKDFDKEKDDIFHPNDIEVLKTEKAPLFPKFKAGDLLLSFRNTNLVAVIDVDTKELKWSMARPWIGQHDPDFGSDGKITVYNNHTDLNQSSIIEIDPKTNKFSDRFGKGNLKFYSAYMGKHQMLPNGGALIVSPGEGRVIEVDSRGNVAFEFNNIFSKTKNAIIQNAVWLPENYFDTNLKCSNEG